MNWQRKDEKFVYRVIALVTVAIASGVGVVVIKESQEIQKLIEPSFARDLLLVFAPLAALLMTGYSMAGKIYSSAGISNEIIVVLGSYSTFLAVAVPSFFKRELDVGERCKFWQLFCDETQLVRDDRFTALFVIIAFALIVLALSRVKIIST